MIRSLLSVVAIASLVPTPARLQAVEEELPPVIVEMEDDAIFRPGIIQLSQEIGGAFVETSKLSAQSPNLFIASSSTRSFGDIFTIRGLGNTRFFSNPSVVLYVDGAPMGNAFAFPASLAGVRSIEVHRGPQPSRFGRNSQAGVIELETFRPSQDVAGTIEASYGSYETYKVEGFAAIPLSEELSVQLSGFHGASDGFMNNTFLDRDTDTRDEIGGRIGLEWRPDATWRVRFSASYEAFDDGSQRISPIGQDDIYRVASDFEGQTDLQTDTQTLSIQKVFDVGVLTLTTGRFNWDLDPNALDLDLSPFPGNTSVIRQDQEQWSQEITFTAGSEDTLKWEVGAFFLDGEINGSAVREFIVPPPTGPFPVMEDTIYTLDETNIAIFGNVRVPLSEQVFLLGGLRLETTDKGIDRFKNSTLAPVPVGDFDAEDSYDQWAPSVGLEYRASENTTVSLSVTRGFKPGGFSAFADNAVNLAYAEEETWSFEAGLATAFPETRATLEATLFWTMTDDYQVERPAGGTEYIVANADEVETFGVELDFRCELVDHLFLVVAAGYTQAEFESHDTAFGDFTGNDVPFSPDFTLAASIEYNSGEGIFGRFGITGVGETAYDEANTDLFTQDSYALIDAEIGYQTRGFSISVFGENIADEDYYSNIITDIFAGVPGTPQTFGLKGSYRF